MLKEDVKLNQIYQKIIAYLVENTASKIAVFGSYARGEAKPDSDLDILVDFSARKTLLELVGLEQDLSELLGIKVDLLTEKSISPYLIDQVKEEMVIIYE